MTKFSVIIPVYNRPQEVKELLESLSLQTCKDFEVLLVEDGSTVCCDKVAESYRENITIRYYFKPNSGRSQTRNYGMERADGDFFVFFDSDCIIPPHYFQTVKEHLEQHYTDCFGGPDKAHSSFSILQKAISTSMTSFLTTGGIRGSKRSMEKFAPRTFNMGFSKEVYKRVGGFKDMFGEDIDMSTRIREAGFSISLYVDAFVYHKRRVSIQSFYKQVYVFGMARVDLYRLHPESLKLVHLLPSVFVLGVCFLLCSSFFCLWALLPLLLYIVSLFIESLLQSKNIRVALLSLFTSFIQLGGYGIGFIRAYIQKVLLHQEIDKEDELQKYYKRK